MKRFCGILFVLVLVFSLAAISIPLPVLAQGDGIFAERVDYTTGDGPNHVVAADLDGDSYSDLAVANHDSATVSVLLNNGDGTFQPRVDYAVENWPRSVTAADLDGDTYSDLAVANRDSDTVSVLLNNGDGTFQPRVDYATGNGALSVAAANLDGDSYPDLAVANVWGETVSVLLNNGDGTFQPEVDYTTGNGPHSVTAANLDGDSYPDLAVANHDSATVSVLLNNGNGTFQAPLDYAVGDWPRSVDAADLDGDSYPDLAVARGDDVVGVLLNNGDGTFQPRVDYATGGYWASEVTAADLDGDSYPDLAVTKSGIDTVSVLLNNGDGTFHAPLDYATGDSPEWVGAVDLNSDSYPDLVVANCGSDTVSVLLNRLSPAVLVEPSSQTGYDLPGTTVSYTLEVINRTGSEDSFDLSISGNTWPTSLSIDNTGPIAHGESVTFTAEVEVSASASPGDTDTATITATLVTDPTMTDTATITAKATSPTPPTFKISINSYIDGRSLLIIRANTVQWHHLDWAAPGRLGFVNYPTVINGIEWYPEWPDVPDEENRWCDCFSSIYEDLDPVLPKEEVEVELKIIQARHLISIAEYPSIDNDYTLIIDFDNDSVGGATWYECELIINVPQPLVADFRAEPTAGVVPLTVNFTDESIGDITKWSWDFGDSGTSNEQSPSRTYSSVGVYTVSLTVSRLGQTDIETKVDYITVYKQPSPTVGGTVMPMDKLRLMMPWIIATALVLLAITSLVLWMKKNRTE